MSEVRESPEAFLLWCRENCLFEALSVLSAFTTVAEDAARVLASADLIAMKSTHLACFMHGFKTRQFLVGWKLERDGQAF